MIVPGVLALVLTVPLVADAGASRDAGHDDVDELDLGDMDGGMPFPREWLREDDWDWRRETFWSVDASRPEELVPEEIPVDAGPPPTVDGGMEEPVAPPQRWVLRDVRIRIDHPRDDEPQELEEFLGLARGAYVTPETAKLAEERLLGLGWYRSAACNVVPVRGEPGRADLRCGLSAARVIAETRIEGLPVLMLEGELQKRIFLRPGERLDSQDPRTADRVERQRKRVEEWLEKQGRFGSKVVILTPNVEGNPRLCNVIVRISGGRKLKVGRVTVSGAGPVHESKIVDAVKGMPWEDFTPKDVDERLERMQRFHREERGYPETRISYEYKVNSKDRVEVDVRIRLGPHLDVRLINETPFDDDKLLDLMTFADNGSVDESEASESAARMLRFLQDRGYYGARVTYERVERGKRHVRVSFTARTHDVGYIKTVRIHGLESLKEEDVRKGSRLASEPQGILLANPRPPFWDTPVVVGNKGILTREEVTADERRIESYMVQQGFTEAHVSSRVEALPDGSVSVVFLVEEGPRYVLRDVEFEGVKSVQAKDLRVAVALGPGAPFIPDLLDQYRESIAGYYARRGFLQTRVDALTAFDAEGAPTLKFVVNEGPRATLRGLFISGNQRTSERIIRQELGIKEGSPMDPEAMSQGVGRLRRTGIFRRINVRYLGVEEGRRDIYAVLQVEERETRTLDGALSVGTQDYLGVAMEARDRNAFGWMVDLSARGQVAPLLGLSLAAPLLGINVDPPQRVQNIFGGQLGMRDRTYFQAALRVPRILGTPVNLQASGDGELRDRPIPKADPTAQFNLGQERKVGGLSFFVPQLGVLDRFYDQERYAQLSARVGAEWPFRVGWLFLFGYGFDLFARQVTESPNERWNLGFPTRAGYLETQLHYTALDNPFDPRRGIAATARLKLGARPLGGEGEFLGGSWNSEGYYTLWRFTFAGALRATAHLVDGGAGNKRIVPRRDLGIAGGDRSVRGYDEDAIRVQRKTLRAGVSPNDPRSIMNEPGLYSGVVNAEIRYALLRGVGFGDLQAAAFVDAALVSDTIPPWAIDIRNRPTEVGLGTGAGLRYVTPVGPIALDWGFDLLHVPNNRVHFQFGYTF
ncbi:MAG: POTRA domain-containing protein [Myxococcota bacterium]